MKKRRLATGALSIALALTMVSTSAFAVSVEFTDVPSSHWASSSISEMAEQGIMSGVGNNKFAPDTTLTGAQFVTMIVRHFYEDKLGDGGDKWYSAFMDVAEQEGILVDTSITAEGVINRYDMAQLMYNVLKAENISTTPLSDTSKVGDWSSVPNTYRDAVSVCYNMGMLSGVNSKGTFNGNGQMTRAQAAVVMDRLLEVCSGSTPVIPEKPEVPAGAVQITSKKQLTGSRGVVECDGGFHMDGSGMTYGMGDIAFTTSGKGTLTFKLEAGDVDVLLRGTLLGKEQSIWEPAEVRELGVVPAGTSKSFTVDVSALQSVGLIPSDASAPSSFAECWITNIYLS